MNNLVKRLFTGMMAIVMVLGLFVVPVYAEGESTEYARKVLYALDTSGLTGDADMDETERNAMRDFLLNSDEGYPNVDVYKVSTVNDEGKGSDYKILTRNYLDQLRATDIPAESNMVISCNDAGGYIHTTYKVTSANPNGFKDLEISLRAFAQDATSETSHGVWVQGSETAPPDSCRSQSSSYFEDACWTELFVFGKGNTYNKYGQTIKIPQAEGKSVYYIDICMYGEPDGADDTAVGRVYFSDVSISESVPVDFADTAEITMLDKNFAEAGCAAAFHTSTSNPDVGLSSEYCEQAGIKGWLRCKNGDGDVYYLTPLLAGAGKTNLWSMGEVVLKLTAPENKTLKGIKIEPDGQCTINEGETAGTSTAFTVFAGNTASELGVVSRTESTIQNSVATNAGSLQPVTIEGNGSTEMYVAIRLDGGQYGNTYLNSLKITGIVEADSSTPGEGGDDVVDSGDYARKVLYALDTSGLTGDTDMDETERNAMRDFLLNSDEGYPSVDVYKVSTVNDEGKGSDYKVLTRNYLEQKAATMPAEKNMVISCNDAGGYIHTTYKVTSTNPNGFKDLAISLRAMAENATSETNHGVWVQGSATAPPDSCRSQSSSYFEDACWTELFVFGKGNTYNKYGQTIKIPQAEGKSVYYIDICMYGEPDGAADTAVGRVYFSDVSISEAVPVDFANATEIEVLNKDFTSSGCGVIHTSTSTPEIGLSSDYCVQAGIKGWFRCNNNGSAPYYLTPLHAGAGVTNLWSMGEVVLKITAPEDMIFKGVKIEPNGQCTINEGETAGTSTAFTVFAGDTANKLGVAERTESTIKNSVVTNAGSLQPVTIKGNGKSEMYIAIRLDGGQYGNTYLNSLKITGIVADDYLVDSIAFNGDGTFPTSGSLTAVYNIASEKAGEEMPASLAFILAVYKKNDDGSIELVDVEVSKQENLVAGGAYNVTITGLPTTGTEAYRAKAFVWNSIDGMIPVSNAVALGAE